MKKSEFLSELESRLSGLPQKDIEERIEFYSEAIDDRMEEGKSEEDAVRDIGTVDEVVNQIASDTPLVKLVSKKMKNNRSLKPWEIVLLILGFPLWFPLVITGLVLLLVFYILVWVLVIVTYSVEASFLASIIWGFAGAFAQISTQGFSYGFLGIGFLGIGLSVLFFYVCKKATILTLVLAKKIVLGIKKAIIGGNKNA